MTNTACCDCQPRHYRVAVVLDFLNKRVGVSLPIHNIHDKCCLLVYMVFMCMDVIVNNDYNK